MSSTTVTGKHRSTATAKKPGQPSHGHDGRVALLFITPTLIGFVVFYLYPTVRGFYWSFTDYSLLSQPVFNGGQNYVAVIHDKNFWSSMLRTLEYVVINIGSEMVLALVLATLMHRLTRSVVLRTTMLLPWLVPNVTTGLIWLWLLDANLGFFNHLLRGMGFNTIGFFSNPNIVIPTISLINTWAYTGYTALLLYAGMLQIPQDLYEAASIDGASALRRMWNITLPSIKATIIILLIMNIGYILEAGFEIQYFLGNGLVVEKSEIIDIFVLKYGIKMGNYSLGTAAGLFKTFVAIILVSGTNFMAGKFGEEKLV